MANDKSNHVAQKRHEFEDKKNPCLDAFRLYYW